MGECLEEIFRIPLLPYNYPSPLRYILCALRVPKRPKIKIKNERGSSQSRKGCGGSEEGVRRSKPSRRINNQDMVMGSSSSALGGGLKKREGSGHKAEGEAGR